VGHGLDLRDLESIPDPILPDAISPGRPASRSPRALLTPPVAAPGPTRQALRNRRLLALFVGLAWLLLTPMLWGYRSNIPPSQIALHIALPTSLGVAALVLAFSPGQAGVGPALKQALFLGVAAPIMSLLRVDERGRVELVLVR
jgi:hypothetical protein